jgi:hypothetical protein
MEMTRLNENAFRFEISAWRREIHTTSAIPKKRAGQVSLCQPAPRRSHARIIPGAVGRFGDKNLCNSDLSNVIFGCACRTDNSRHLIL